MHVPKKTDARMFLPASWHVPPFNTCCALSVILSRLFSRIIIRIAMSEAGQLQAAKAELQRKNKNLRTAIQRHDELLESSSPESQEVLKAELGVAKAKLGVAEAKLGVAEAEDETPGRQSEIAKAEMGVAKAEMGVAKAEWDVAIAVYNSEAKTSNQGRLEFLQGQIEGRKERYNDSKEAYKRLEGQLSSLDFHAPPG